MKWPVKIEIIWVFSLLIKMMSFVFCMKKVISKKTFLRTVSKKLGIKKSKFVC